MASLESDRRFTALVFRHVHHFVSLLGHRLVPYVFRWLSDRRASTVVVPLLPWLTKSSTNCCIPFLFVCQCSRLLYLIANVHCATVLVFFFFWVAVLVFYSLKVFCAVILRSRLPPLAGQGMGAFQNKRWKNNGRQEKVSWPQTSAHSGQSSLYDDDSRRSTSNRYFSCLTWLLSSTVPSLRWGLHAVRFPMCDFKLAFPPTMTSASAPVSHMLLNNTHGKLFKLNYWRCVVCLTRITRWKNKSEDN